MLSVSFLYIQKSLYFRDNMVYNIDDAFLPTVLSAEDKTRKFQAKYKVYLNHL